MCLSMVAVSATLLAVASRLRRTAIHAARVAVYPDERGGGPKAQSPGVVTQRSKPQPMKRLACLLIAAALAACTALPDQGSRADAAGTAPAAAGAAAVLAPNPNL